MSLELIPSKSNTATVTHAVTEDLAGKDGVSEENGSEFLKHIIVNHHVQVLARMIHTTSVRVLGRLEMYKLVEPSSPSALSRELKDSCSNELAIAP